jgi:hypothetical protein
MDFRRSFLALGWVLIGTTPAPPAEWTSLFDGKTLQGWRVDRDAIFTVEDGVIVGRQGPMRRPGGLFTTGEWDDFELELEWKVEGPAESGIWFRRTSTRRPPASTGCQADVNDGRGPEGILSGSLWCFGKGFVAVNRDRASVKQGGWNRLRIRAVGQQITIEQNGKVVVQARDDSCKSGHIGIQIPRGKEHVGMAIYVRNIGILSTRRRESG